MPRYHGKGLRVLISTGGTSTATPLLGVTEWSVDRSVDRVETTAGGDANKQYVQGFADCQISFAGVWDDTETKLLAAAGSADGIKAYLYPDFANAAGKFVSGPMWLDASFAVSSTEAVRYTGTMASNGTVTYNL